MNPPRLVDTSNYGYTQIVSAPNTGKTVYVSGQTGTDVTGQLQSKDVDAQIRASFGNLAVAIDASGARPEHVVKTQIMLVHPCSEYALLALDEEIKKLFGDTAPASTLVFVPRLASNDALFEIDATLVVPE